MKDYVLRIAAWASRLAPDQGDRYQAYKLGVTLFKLGLL